MWPKKLLLFNIKYFTWSQTWTSRGVQPNYPKIIFLQSTLINIVVVFLLFVSFFAWKTDRRLNNLVVPIALNKGPSSTKASPGEIQTVQLAMERGEASGSNCRKGTEASWKSQPKSPSSYHVTRRSEDPFTFHKVVEPEKRSEDNAVLCQSFLPNIVIITSVKNTLNINGISILYLIEFLPYNMVQFVIYLFQLDCQDYLIFINILRSIKLVSLPLYLCFIYMMFSKKWRTL